LASSGRSSRLAVPVFSGRESGSGISILLLVWYNL